MAITFKVDGATLIEHVESRIEELRVEVVKSHVLHYLERMLKVLSREATFEMTVEDAMELGLRFNDWPPHTKE